MAPLTSVSSHTAQFTQDKIDKDITEIQQSQHLLPVKGQFVIHGVISHHSLLNQVVYLGINFFDL